MRLKRELRSGIKRKGFEKRRIRKERFRRNWSFRRRGPTAIVNQISGGSGFQEGKFPRLPNMRPSLDGNRDSFFFFILIIDRVGAELIVPCANLSPELKKTIITISIS